MQSNDYAGESKNTVPTDAPGGILFDRVIEEQELLFPVGILGFPTARRYRLEPLRPQDDVDSPFFNLRCTDQDLSFTLITPHQVGIQYQLSIDDQLLEFLKAASKDQLSILLIVTVRDRIEDITVNLQGPLLINTTSSLAVQLVVEQYPVRYQLVRAGKQSSGAARGSSSSNT
jgi:flagellar assembly factor FliW